MLTDAINFSLDLQEKTDIITLAEFRLILDKYKGKYNDGVYIFPDNSSAEWIESEKSFKLK